MSQAPIQRRPASIESLIAKIGIGSGTVSEEFMRSLSRLEGEHPADPSDEPSSSEKAAKDVKRLVGLKVPQRDAQDAASPECKQTQAVLAVNKCVAKDPLATLVLSGAQLGIGKTVASAVWLLRQIEAHRSRGRNCRMWVDAVKLCRWTVYDANNELESLESAPLLAIQDLGEETPQRPTDWQGQLTVLLHSRQQNDLPTCITTNLNAQQFRECYGERFYDRLKQHARWVTVGGPNLRRPLAV